MVPAFPENAAKRRKIDTDSFEEAIYVSYASHVSILTHFRSDEEFLPDQHRNKGSAKNEQVFIDLTEEQESKNSMFLDPIHSYADAHGGLREPVLACKLLAEVQLRILGADKLGTPSKTLICEPNSLEILNHRILYEQHGMLVVIHSIKSDQFGYLCKKESKPLYRLLNMNLVQLRLRSRRIVLTPSWKTEKCMLDVFCDRASVNAVLQTLRLSGVTVLSPLDTSKLASNSVARLDPYSNVSPTPYPFGNAHHYANAYSHSSLNVYENMYSNTISVFHGQIADKKYVTVNEESDLASVFGDVSDQMDGIVPAETPSRISTPLLELQKSGLAWMLKREHSSRSSIKHAESSFYDDIAMCRGGILGDEMGLGKTLTSLSLIASGFDENSRKQKSTLIVAPVSVLSNWEMQIQAHVKRGTMKAILFHGTSRHSSLREMSNSCINVVITTYQTLVTEWKDFSSPLRKIEFERIILDEAHCIRNKGSQLSKTICEMTAEKKWCLTGTPMQNRTDDLFALLRFLEASPLNIYKNWQNHITKPLQKRNKRALQKLKIVLKIICLRRLKSQVFNEDGMPKLSRKTSSQLILNFSADEKKAYDYILSNNRATFKRIIAEGSVMKNYFNVLELLLLQRQCCDHVLLLNSSLRESILEEMKENSKKIAAQEIEDDIILPIECENLKPFSDWKSSKILALIQDIKSDIAQGIRSKFVVFSQWTRMMNLIEYAFKAHGITWVRLDGSMTRKARNDSIMSFQEDPVVNVFLASLTAGNMGITLTAASKVYLMDPWWNPATEDQAVDRVHRVGQTKDVETVQVIMRGSIEEKILILQDRKRMTMSATMGKMSKDEVKKIQEKDLEFLMLD